MTSIGTVWLQHRFPANEQRYSWIARGLSSDYFSTSFLVPWRKRGHVRSYCKTRTKEVIIPILMKCSPNSKGVEERRSVTSLSPEQGCRSVTTLARTTKRRLRNPPEQCSWSVIRLWRLHLRHPAQAAARDFVGAIGRIAHERDRANASNLLSP